VSIHHNVFDDNPDIPDGTVPVVMHIDGQKVTVGQARVSQRDGYIHADMDINADTPEEVKEMLSSGLNGVSIADLGVNEVEVDALSEFEPHDHKATGCEVCGIETPNWRPFGKPSLPIHREGES
jgi:hypothetical protein